MRGGILAAQREDGSAHTSPQLSFAAEVQKLLVILLNCMAFKKCISFASLFLYGKGEVAKGEKEEVCGHKTAFEKLLCSC